MIGSEKGLVRLISDPRLLILTVSSVTAFVLGTPKLGELYSLTFDHTRFTVMTYWRIQSLVWMFWCWPSLFGCSHAKYLMKCMQSDSWLHSCAWNLQRRGLGQPRARASAMSIHWVIALFKSFFILWGVGVSLAMTYCFRWRHFRYGWSNACCQTSRKTWSYHYSSDWAI